MHERFHNRNLRNASSAFVVDDNKSSQGSVGRKQSKRRKNAESGGLDFEDTRVGIIGMGAYKDVPNEIEETIGSSRAG